MIVKIYNDESFQPPQFTIHVNEPSNCKDSVEGEFDYDTEGNMMNSIGSGTTFVSTITGSNLYYVRCRDDFNNTMETATIYVAGI